MRLGLIARADHRGLAIQTAGVHRALRPTKTMIVDCPSAQPLPLHLEQFPGAGVTVIKGLPTAQDFRTWLQGLDAVYTAETSYNKALWSEAERQGVKTVLHANYEFLDHSDRPTLWAAPSMWHYDDFPDPKRYLPVPIETDRFPAVTRSGAGKHFLHIVGRPAVHDRNGTPDLLDALQYVRSATTVTIRCQDPTYVPRLLQGRRIPGHIGLIVDGHDTTDYWDNYTGDVLVMPRRFGGLCLPAQEALGAGMPVIMPAISPNEWLDPDWLVPAENVGAFRAKTRVDLYSVDPKALAAKIDQFATDPEFYAKAAGIARDLAESMSWKSLLPVYEKVFAEL